MDKIFQLGFTDDKDNLLFKETFKDGEKLKNIHIDVYPNNPIESYSPFTLFVRATEKDVSVSNDGNRLILKTNDRFGTHIMNVLLSDITKCFAQVANEHCFTFVVNIQNIWYNMAILN